MDKTENKSYIGDGVYAELDSCMIRLTTENGIRVTNEIFLEPQVLKQLIAYAKKHDFYTE